MEVLPCSRVAHIERSRKPYNNDIDYYAKRNALRAAEVWMDGFKSHVYMAWNIPMTVSGRRGRGPIEAGAGGGSGRHPGAASAVVPARRRCPRSRQRALATAVKLLGGRCPRTLTRAHAEQQSRAAAACTLTGVLPAGDDSPSWATAPPSGSGALPSELSVGATAT